jgi:dTDP-4-dehydrorhamnose 3,5-epimerase
MIFIETKLKGAFIIEPERLEDKRGFFARTFDEKEFAARRLSNF